MNPPMDNLGLHRRLAQSDAISFEQHDDNLDKLEAAIGAPPGPVAPRGVIIEKVVAATISGTYTIDPTAGSIFELTASANTSIVFPALAEGLGFCIRLSQGSYTITLPSTVRWFGSAPTHTTTAGRFDEYAFCSTASRWIGYDGGRNLNLT